MSSLSYSLHETVRLKLEGRSRALSISNDILHSILDEFEWFQSLRIGVVLEYQWHGWRWKAHSLLVQYELDGSFTNRIARLSLLRFSQFGIPCQLRRRTSKVHQ